MFFQPEAPPTKNKKPRAKRRIWSADVERLFRLRDGEERPNRFEGETVHVEAACSKGRGATKLAGAAKGKTKKPGIGVFQVSFGRPWWRIWERGEL